MGSLLGSSSAILRFSSCVCSQAPVGTNYQDIPELGLGLRQTQSLGWVTMGFREEPGGDRGSDTQTSGPGPLQAWEPTSGSNGHWLVSGVSCPCCLPSLFTPSHVHLLSWPCRKQVEWLCYLVPGLAGSAGVPLSQTLPNSGSLLLSSGHDLEVQFYCSMPCHQRFGH